MNDPTLAKVSLLVASLAAGAALLNAIAALIATWRDNRSLKIKMTVGRYSGHAEPDQFDVFPFNLTIQNPARSPNLVRSVQCWIDDAEVQCTPIPLGSLDQPLAPSAMFSGQVLLAARWVLGVNFKTIRFKIRPLRGRRRCLKFGPRDLLMRF